MWYDYTDAVHVVIELIQVATSHGLPPTPARRILFILYQTTVPYLAERIRFETNSLSRSFNHYILAEKKAD